MKLHDSVELVLKHKGSRVYSIPARATVYHALEKMAQYGVGALLVMDGGKLLGVMSERDYARKVILDGRSSKDVEVWEIMSSPAVVVNATATVDECMQRMTDKRCRHLPVMSRGNVIGVVSIGDLVHWIISAQDLTIRQLENYIYSNYPA